MVFNSYIFVLLFLPICLIGYFGLNHLKKYSWGQAFLIGMSLWFYGYFNVKYLTIIIVSILVNYVIYRGLEMAEEKRARKVLLNLGLLFNLGILIYFKYMDFFISNINHLFRTNIKLLGILLPLGISFFTFQQISFIVDAYKGEVPEYSLMYYASYVTFFPQLIAGPIVLHSELVPQFLDESRKKIDWDNFSKGIYIFALGLAKKVLLADTFGGAVNWGFSNISSLNSTNAIIVMMSYTFQIYFDFSGYCDMAVGIGKMLNLELPVNFNSPYKALTITEFWDRWHITLTRFFTKYVYIPLGGNRKGKVRTYLNIMVVFLLSGLWHGANWTFIFWGICHGIFSVITRYFKSFFEKMNPVLSWMITFTFINITWVFFRAESLDDAMQLLMTIIRMDFGGINSELYSFFYVTKMELISIVLHIEALCPYFAIIVLFVIAIVLILGRKNAYEKMVSLRLSYKNIFITVILLCWCIVSFSEVSTFLYFNF